ncbi:hypothetical protein [Metabacillus niabensis]|uniref:hypothetical protein n=1 Tax=Metabacillus niabensis TaxID=324854 RepID=UPI0039A3BF5C
MSEKHEKELLKKGRLTLTGNKMPDDVYKKLEEKGANRKLTPYIVGLVEKEETMDTLIESLSTLIKKIDHLSERFTDFEASLNGVNIPIAKETIPDDGVVQGDLEISDKVIGGIEEEIEDFDF